MSDTSTHTDTGNGIISGVTAAKTPEQIRAEQAAMNPANWQQQTVPMQPQQTGQVFTAEDIERARQEEKAKVYPQLQQVDEIRKELDQIKAEREAAEAAKKAAEEEAEKARKLAEEESMDVRQLFARKEAELTERMNEIQRQAEFAEALLEKERRFSALNEYKSRRIDDLKDQIIPPLVKYVGGETEEEIEASLAEAAKNSQEILMGVQQAQQQQWIGMRGTAPTAPVGGPLENVPVDKPISEQDVRNMSMAEYARNRGRLHQAASRQFYGGRG